MRNGHTPRRGGDTGRNASSRSTPKKDSKPNKSKGSPFWTLVKGKADSGAKDDKEEELPGISRTCSGKAVYAGLPASVQACVSETEFLEWPDALKKELVNDTWIGYVCGLELVEDVCLRQFLALPEGVR